MHVCAWMVSHSSLNQPRIQGNMCCNEQSGKTFQHKKEENTPTGTISIWPTSIMWCQTQTFLTSALCFTCSKTTKQSSLVWHSDVNASSSAGKLVDIVSPQHDNFTELRWPSWESLLERTTNKWSSTSRRYAWDRRQQDDLGNIHVRDTEGGGRFLTRLSRIFTFHQEHGLRAYQTIVWYFREIDQGSKSRFTWNIYNWGGHNSIGVKYFVRSKFHQVTQHCSEFQNSKQRWKKIKFRLNSSKIESSSRRCTMTLIWRT